MLAALLDGDIGVPGVGSKSQRDGALVWPIADRTGSFCHSTSVMSGSSAPGTMLESPDTWPRRVIVMNLSRVGGEAGPDFDRLRAIRAIAGGHAVFAAAACVTRRDLAACEALGCAGALVATALHDGQLDRNDLQAYRQA